MATKTMTSREERMRMILELHGYGNIEDTATHAVDRLRAHLDQTTGGAHYDWVCMLERNARHAIYTNTPLKQRLHEELREAATNSWFRGSDDEQRILNDLHLALLAEGRVA